MRFIRNMLLGYRSYFKAIKFIFKHKLYWYFFIPAVLMLIIYKLGTMVQGHYIQPEVSNMNQVVWYFVWVMIEIAIAIMLMEFAKYLVVIILSPLISSISMKTEKILTGKTYPFSMKQLIHDIKRATRIVIRNMMWYFTFILIVYIVARLGWKDPKSSPVFYLTFAIGFFYYGFGFLDYINERRRLDMDESITFVRDHRGLAIAIGSVYSLLILVPVDPGALFDWSGFGSDPIGTLGNFGLHFFLWICASVAAILAIVAATIAMNDLVDLKSNPYSQKVEDVKK